MMDFTSIDRLQPCLIDRLADENPSKRTEKSSERIVSVQRYKQGLKRDLEWLLNSRSYLDQDIIERNPMLADSVLNFGIRDITGLSTESVDIRKELVGIITQAIKSFEPRILPDSLKVEYVDPKHSQSDQESGEAFNHLQFRISGTVWLHPLPMDFVFRTDVGMEDGNIVVEY